MSISRKLIVPATIAILTLYLLILRTNAENVLPAFNGNKVLVVDNGFEFEIKAYGNTIEEILKNAGINLNEKDLVFPTKTDNFQKIIIIRAKTIYLNLYGDKKEFITLKNRVGEFFEEVDIKSSKGDLVNYSYNDEIFPGMEISIKKKPVPPPPPKPKPTSNNVSQFVKTGEIQSGSASWYNHIPGNYCASLRYPKGTKLLVTNTANGKSIIVTVNDRGPFNSRIIDLEKNAFAQIGSLSSGVINVRVERIQ